MRDDDRGRFTNGDTESADDGAGADIEVTSIEGMPTDAPPPAALDDSDPAEDDSEAVGGAAAADAGQLTGERLVQELREDLLRARADFENFRKRQQRERSELVRHAAAELVETLLPVVDNFKRAMSIASGESEADGSFVQGLQMIYAQLMSTLERAGLTPIPTEGEAFDPHLHEAVAREETDAAAPNTILEELEPGYRFRDRLLKPARVRVAVAPSS